MVKVVQAVWCPASRDTEEIAGCVARDIGVWAAGDDLLELVGHGHAVEWFIFQYSACLDRKRGKVNRTTHAATPTAPAPSPTAMAWPKFEFTVLLAMVEMPMEMEAFTGLRDVAASMLGGQRNG